MPKSKHLHKVNQIKAGAEVYILNGSKVLMFKRSNTTKRFPGCWIGPGGHVDSDEDFLKAAIREVYEETGTKITAKDAKLKAVIIHKWPERKETYLVTIFLIKIFEKQDKTITSEGSAAWIEKDELEKMENVFPPAKYYFDHVLNDKTGILYTNLVWNEEKGLIEESSVSLDEDY